jgi:hypothetical protein
MFSKTLFYGMLGVSLLAAGITPFLFHDAYAPSGRRWVAEEGDKVVLTGVKPYVPEALATGIPPTQEQIDKGYIVAVDCTVTQGTVNEVTIMSCKNIGY